MSTHSVWDAYLADNGQTYYHNPSTGKTSWELPDETPQAAYSTSTPTRCGGEHLGVISAEGPYDNRSTGKNRVCSGAQSDSSDAPCGSADVSGGYLGVENGHSSWQQGGYSGAQSGGHSVSGYSGNGVSNGELLSDGYAGQYGVQAEYSVGQEDASRQYGIQAGYYGGQQDTSTVTKATSAWKPIWAEEQQMYYYYNESTRETQWENPDQAILENSPKTSGSTTATCVECSDQHEYVHSQWDNSVGAVSEQQSFPLQEQNTSAVPSYGNGYHNGDRTGQSGGVYESEHQRLQRSASLLPRSRAASAPAEREGLTLKRALSRKEESLRRLQRAREAAARARAAAAAEATSRRAAKLKAKLAAKEEASALAGKASPVTPATSSEKESDRMEEKAMSGNGIHCRENAPDTEMPKSIEVSADGHHAAREAGYRKGMKYDVVGVQNGGGLFEQADLHPAPPALPRAEITACDGESGSLTSMQSVYAGEHVQDVAVGEEEWDENTADIPVLDVYGESAVHRGRVREDTEISSALIASGGVESDTKTTACRNIDAATANGITTLVAMESTAPIMTPTQQQQQQQQGEQHQSDTREAQIAFYGHAELIQDDSPSHSVITPGERLRAPPPRPPTQSLALIAPPEAAVESDASVADFGVHSSSIVGDEAAAAWEEVALFGPEADEELLGLEAVLRHAGSNHPATPAHETPAGRENGAREDEAGAIRESEIVDTSSSPAEDMRALSLDCGETHAGSLFSSEALLGGAEGDASSAEHGSEQSSPTIEDARSGILLLDHDGVSPQQNSSADVPSSSGGGRVALSSPCNDSLVALLRRAATRISLLLELLGSAGEEDSWAVLVGGNEHSACKRLADYAACGSRFFMDPVGVLNDESCDSDSVDSASSALAMHLKDEGRRLCRSAFGSLAMLGRLDPDMWAALAAPQANHVHQRQSVAGKRDSQPPALARESRLARLLSLCSEFAKVEGQESASLPDSEAYGVVMGDDERGNEEEEGNTARTALVLIYEALTGCRRGGIDNISEWNCMRELVHNLMDVIVGGDEGSYMQATKGLLAANDPCFRASISTVTTTKSPEKTISPRNRTCASAACSASLPSLDSRPSFVIPLLASHPARNEMQGAVLHILNEEGYPNGDSQLAKMCLGFCADTFGVEREKALFYINDVKVMVDVIIRELLNLPENNALRSDYTCCLHRLVEKSEWATRGDRYREADLELASGCYFGPRESDADLPPS